MAYQQDGLFFYYPDLYFYSIFSFPVKNIYFSYPAIFNDFDPYFSTALNYYPNCSYPGNLTYEPRCRPWYIGALNTEGRVHYNEFFITK